MENKALAIALIDKFFPKGVLNRNDKTTMKTVEPTKKGDNFSDQIKVFFYKGLILI